MIEFVMTRARMIRMVKAGEKIGDIRKTYHGWRAFNDCYLDAEEHRQIANKLDELNEVKE